MLDPSTPLILALAAAAVGAAPWPGARQQDTQGTISCGSRASVSRPSPFKTTAFVPNPTERGRLTALQPWRLGPFDAATYGFQTMDVYLVPSGEAEKGMGGGYRDYEAVIHLGGRDSLWLRVVPNGRAGPEVPTLTGPNDIASDADTVRLAAAGVPVVVLSLEYEDPHSSSRTKLVLDFRPRRPRVPVSLECVDLGSQGACGTPDAEFDMVASDIQCAWDASLGDFACDETSSIGATWGAMRRSRRHYPLIAGPRPAASDTAALAAAVRSALAAGGRTASVVVDGWGRVEVLRAIDTTTHGRVLLVGVPRRDYTMRAGFVLVPTATEGDAVIDVKEVRLVGRESYQGERGSFSRGIALPGTPDQAVRFVTRVVRDAPPGPLILQVLAEEGDSSGVGRAVYWIGVQDTSPSIVASALRISTDTCDYDHCGTGFTPTIGVSARIRKAAGFRASLDVEGPHHVELAAPLDENAIVEGEEDETAFDQCPRTAQVGWDASRGFTVQLPAAVAPCPESPRPRFVRIDENGNISVAKPGPIR